MTAPDLAIVDDYPPFLDYLGTKIEPMQPPGRTARLDADVAAAFPSDARVNDALRRLIAPRGARSE